MTIKTLEYIHRVLLETEVRTRDNYQVARRNQDPAADEHMKKHLDAVNALHDFENQEW